MKGGSAIRAAISLTLRADIIATKNAVFKDRWYREHVAMGSNGGFVRVVSTKCNSQDS